MSEPAPARRHGPGARTLALAAFLKIAMASLGGGLSAWALRVIVEQRRWLNEEEFLAAYTICRILPGPNQVNMAVYVGDPFGGLRGALAAVAGLTLSRSPSCSGSAAAYFHYRQACRRSTRRLRGAVAAAGRA